MAHEDDLDDIFGEDDNNSENFTSGHSKDHNSADEAKESILSSTDDSDEKAFIEQFFDDLEKEQKDLEDQVKSEGKNAGEALKDSTISGKPSENQDGDHPESSDGSTEGNRTDNPFKEDVIPDEEEAQEDEAPDDEDETSLIDEKGEEEPEQFNFGDPSAMHTMPGREKPKNADNEDGENPRGGKKNKPEENGKNKEPEKNKENQAEDPIEDEDPDFGDETSAKDLEENTPDKNKGKPLSPFAAPQSKKSGKNPKKNEDKKDSPFAGVLGLPASGKDAGNNKGLGKASPFAAGLGAGSALGNPFAGDVLPGKGGKKGSPSNSVSGSNEMPGKDGKNPSGAKNSSGEKAGSPKNNTGDIPQKKGNTGENPQAINSPDFENAGLQNPKGYNPGNNSGGGETSNSESNSKNTNNDPRGNKRQKGNNKPGSNSKNNPSAPKMGAPKGKTGKALAVVAALCAIFVFGVMGIVGMTANSVVQTTTMEEESAEPANCSNEAGTEEGAASDGDVGSVNGVAVPATGKITSGFGGGPRPGIGDIHKGYDIANAIGTNIYAAHSGTVIAAGPATGYGLWIRIQSKDDPSIVTEYGHQIENLVKVGDEVTVGQHIAEMGSNGFSSGSHLHFQINKEGGTQIHPGKWFKDNGIEGIGMYTGPENPGEQIYAGTNKPGVQEGNSVEGVSGGGGGSKGKSGKSGRSKGSSKGGSKGDVFLIGDSLSVRAENKLKEKIPGIKIDAKVSRQFAAGLSILESSNTKADTVVMALGTNGTFNQSDIDRAKRAANGGRLILMTVGGPKVPSVSTVNPLVKKNRGKVGIADWEAAVKRNPNYISSDGVHQTPSGTEAFAEVIADAVGSGGGSSGGSSGKSSGGKGKTRKSKLKASDIPGGTEEGLREYEKLKGVYGPGLPGPADWYRLAIAESGDNPKSPPVMAVNTQAAGLYAMYQDDNVPPHSWNNYAEAAGVPKVKSTADIPKMSRQEQTKVALEVWKKVGWAYWGVVYGTPEQKERGIVAHANHGENDKAFDVNTTEALGPSNDMRVDDSYGADEEGEGDGKCRCTAGDSSKDDVTEGGGETNAINPGENMDKYAKMAIGIAKGEFKMTDDETIALLMAIATESSFSNLGSMKPGLEESMRYTNEGHGADHQSVGILQQQYQIWDNYSSLKDLMNPAWQMGSFIRVFQGTDKSLPKHMRIQKTQRSAFADGSNYLEQEGLAKKLFNKHKNAKASEKDKKTARENWKKRGGSSGGGSSSGDSDSGSDSGSSDSGDDSESDYSDGECTSSGSDDDFESNAGSIAKRAVEYAMKQVGKQYVWGATGPDTFDCSGLVLWSYTKAGIEEAGMTPPRVAAAQGKTGKRVKEEDLVAGDLIFNGENASHVMMYAGDGKVVHAADSNTGIVETTLDKVKTWNSTLHYQRWVDGDDKALKN